MAGTPVNDEWSAFTDVNETASKSVAVGYRANYAMCNGVSKQTVLLLLLSFGERTGAYAVRGYTKDQRMMKEQENKDK